MNSSSLTKTNRSAKEYLTHPKEERGITLVALIITIIVLLILAMVSIRLVMNGGIISKAERGVADYKIAEEKEQIQLGYSNYKLAQAMGTPENLSVNGATVTGNGPWTITFPSEKIYTLSADGKTITEQIQSNEEEKTTIIIENNSNNSGEKNIGVVTGRAVFNSSEASNIEILNAFGESQSEFYNETLNTIVNSGGLTSLSSSFEQNDDLHDYCPIFIQNYDRRYGDGLFTLKSDTEFQEVDIVKVLLIIKNENDETNPFIVVCEGIYTDEGTEFIITKETLELMNNKNACIGFVSNC